MTTAWHNGQCGLRLALECVLQDLRQSRLPFWHPARVVLANRLLVVPEQISDVGDWHTPLQEDACEGMPETVGRCRFCKGSGELESVCDSPTPDIGDGLEAVRPRDDERSLAILLCARVQTIAQPVRHVSEHVSAVFLGSNEHLIAVQTLYAKKRRVGDSEAGVEHQPEQVLQVFTRPDTDAGFVLPLDFHVIAGGKSAIDFVVREGRLVGGLVRADCL